MRSEKLFRPFIRLMFNSHCGGIRLDEVSLMKRIGALLLCGILLLPAAGASGTPWPAWAAEALAWGREKSVSRAFLASPGQRLTRGAVARLLYESAGQPAAHEECPFSDVSEKDAAAVGWQQGRAISLAWEMEPMSQAALSPGRNLPLSSGDRREHPRYRSKDSSVLGTPALCRNGRGMLCSGASRPG